MLEQVHQLGENVALAAIKCAEAIRSGNKVLFCGNGGSAADSQHLAAELTGRFERDRAPLPAIALTTDSSALTCIANDFGYQCVFSRQIDAIGRNGDVLIAISTSGNSQSVNLAIESALKKNIYTIGLLGRDGGGSSHLCDCAIVVPSDKTSRIQEMHILIGHTICEEIESQLGLE